MQRILRFDGVAHEREHNRACLAYEGVPFKYQSRCLEELRRGYAALSDEARRQVDPLLEAHDCLEPLQG